MFKHVTLFGLLIVSSFSFGQEPTVQCPAETHCHKNKHQCSTVQEENCPHQGLPCHDCCAATPDMFNDEIITPATSSNQQN